MGRDRFRGLAVRGLGNGLWLAEARAWRARLVGLALLAEMPAELGLLLPRCRCVHTFGMRFALDLVFLDAGGRVVRVVRGVGPRRVVACRRAAAVVEARAGEGGRFAAALDPGLGSPRHRSRSSDMHPEASGRASR